MEFCNTFGGKAAVVMPLPDRQIMTTSAARCCTAARFQRKFAATRAPPLFQDNSKHIDADAPDGLLICTVKHRHGSTAWPSLR